MLYSASMKSYQYQNFNILKNIQYSSTATLAIMLLVNGGLGWRKIPVPRALKLLVYVMLVLFVFFAVFRTLIASFSAFQVAPKQLIFLYNTMETAGIRQGMGIMHSDVLDTLFHSGDA